MLYDELELTWKDRVTMGLKYSIMDLETTIRNRDNGAQKAIGKLQANPNHPDNKVHLWGSTFVKHIDNLHTDTFFNRSDMDVNKDDAQFWYNLDDSNIIVGTNFKFDLLYMLKHDYDRTMDFFRKGGVIWDCMQVQYLLSNQQEMFAPLSNKIKSSTYVDAAGTTVTQDRITKRGMSERYGGSSKPDRIAKYWDAGIDTPDIPQIELMEYLCDDLKNTGIVFREQYKLVMKHPEEFQNLVMTQMQAMVGTMMMEYNGMNFDRDNCHKDAMILAEEHDTKYNRLRNWMLDEMVTHGDVGNPVPVIDEINPSSTQQLTTLLLGGTFTIKRKVSVLDDVTGDPILVKSGPRKGLPRKRIENISTIIKDEHAIGDDYRGFFDKTENGNYVIDDKVLKKITKQKHSRGIVENIAQLIIDYRKLNKTLKTYYLAYEALTWPNTGCIHGSINHCSTGTGRTSSNAPNIQNVTGDTV